MRARARAARRLRRRRGEERDGAETLPGTVHGVARECDAVATRGARAMACVMNLLDEASIERCVARAMARYGRVDAVVNNASALWWQDIEDTPTKKYDLIQGVNARGAFVLTRACLRAMRAGGRGGTGDLDGTAAAEEL